MRIECDRRGIERAELYEAGTTDYLGVLEREPISQSYLPTYRATAANGKQIFARYHSRLYDEIPERFRREARYTEGPACGSCGVPVDTSKPFFTEGDDPESGHLCDGCADDYLEGVGGVEGEVNA
jgi:hypothetical protein